jgi:acyl-CoA thioesterase FadM
MTSATDRRAGIALRPFREGANIRTWIGFKHFMYLAEEAVFCWFRDRGIGPSVLFHEYGLGLSVTDSSVQLPAVLDVDDTVEAEVTGGPAQFTVRLYACRPARPAVLRGRVTVALVAEPDAPVAAAPPPELAPLVAGGPGAGSEPVLAGGPEDLAPPGSGAFVQTWRVPYYYCQYSQRLQHSGYVRALEDVVDRFLADRGLSIAAMLSGRGWIPVVSRARVRILADAFMEETLHTVFSVTDVLKRVSFDARADWYAQRGGSLVHTATGRILHAYAIARGEGAGRLAELEDTTIAALTAGGRR